MFAHDALPATAPAPARSHGGRVFPLHEAQRRTPRPGPYLVGPHLVGPHLAAPPTFEGMVGSAPLMVELFGFIERLAPYPTTALITGESGTGKELVAPAIPPPSSRTPPPPP